jgi:hypothetical protein
MPTKSKPSAMNRRQFLSTRAIATFMAGLPQLANTTSQSRAQFNELNFNLALEQDHFGLGALLHVV